MAKKPNVILPSGPVSITDCAQELFSLIAPTRTLLNRGGAVVSLVKREDGLPALEILQPTAARSFFEKHANLFAWRVGRNGKPVLQQAICSHDLARALLDSAEARTLLPSVKGLINCPVLRVVDRQLVSSGVGYDPVTKLFVTGGQRIPEVGLPTAKERLLDLFAEFDFATPGDCSRHFASLMNAALKLAGLLSGRVPADVAEADDSQSGKTYRQKCIAAVYNEKVALITNRQKGVGSIDEIFDQQLISGRPFLQFDNFRGRFDSAHLEAFMTADGSFLCRVPYRGAVEVAPENFFVMLSSNGVNTTRDLANRSNIIRNRKRVGYAFKSYLEGDLLAHIRANQAFYLGCVFAVIRPWHAQGMPGTNELRHDYREWVQKLDWIVQNVFGLAPIMDGHREAQEQVSNPSLIWLRSLAIAVAQNAELGRWFSATQIYVLCENLDISIPGLVDGADEGKAVKVIGMIMAKLFGEQHSIVVDDYEVRREERKLPRTDPNSGGSMTGKVYSFDRISAPTAPTAATP